MEPGERSGAPATPGSLGSIELVVTIDFSSRLAQLRWFVTMPMASPDLKPFRRDLTD